MKIESVFIQKPIKIEKPIEIEDPVIKNEELVTRIEVPVIKNEEEPVIEKPTDNEPGQPI